MVRRSPSAEFWNERVAFSAALHSGPYACNLASLHPYLLRAVVISLLVASCSSPLCRPGLVEQTGRCIPAEDIAKPCQPACSPTAHEVCDGDIEPPSCICAPGYSGIPCTWTGVLEDPGFQDQDAWTRTEGAEVLQNRTDTLIDRGFARIERSAACNGGAVSQTVQMPSYEVAEPLVAQVTYRAQNLYGLALGFNRAWTQLPVTSEFGWTTEPERVCLGEAAYGDAVTVQLSAPEEHPSCFGQEEGEIQVDRLDIVPAAPGECPAPGEVLNGTGEVGGGGWQFETTDVADADLAEGVGRGATSGVQLVVGASVGAAAWTRLSVPSSESLESPALLFWWRGTAGQPFGFRMGRYIGTREDAIPLDDVYGNDSDVNYLYCLPPWTHGNVVDLIFRTWADGTTSPRELVIDDVEIVSEPRCGTSTDRLDPGFDAGPARIMGVTHTTPYSSAKLRTEPSLSRTGDGGVLELSYWNEAAVIYLETWVLVPESNGNDGPAIRFWWNVPTTNTKPIRSVLGRAAVDPRFLQPGGGWQEPLASICLPRKWSGRWFRFQWRRGDIPPIGNADISPIRIYIDDLELVTDSNCPVSD